MDQLSSQDRQSLGRYLKYKLDDLGMTQDALAEQMGVSAARISRIVNGTSKRPRGYEDVLREALGVSIEDILEDARLMRGVASGESVNLPSQPTSDGPLVIAFCNEKGGVGKTTASINVAVAWNQDLGLDILYIDLDTQGSASNYLTDLSDGGTALMDALAQAAVDPDLSRLEAQETSSGLDLCAGGEALEELTRMSKGAPQFLLKDALETTELPYDVVVLDTPPSMGVHTMNALFAAHAAIIVTEAEPMSVSGVERTLQREKTIARRNAGFVFAAVLENNAREQRLIRRGQRSYMEKHDTIGPLLAQNYLPAATAYSEAFFTSKGIYDYGRANKKERLALRRAAAELAERVGLVGGAR